MSALDKIKLDNINLNILSGLTIESLPNESESNQYQNLNK